MLSQYSNRGFVKKIAIYLRVSSKGQASDGQGLDGQYAACTRIIRQNNWKFYDVYYVKDGVSGDIKVKNRPEFKRMIEDGKQRKFNAVIVSTIDRLGRQLAVTEKAIKLIFEAGLELYVGNMQITDTLIGVLFYQIYSSFAQYDRSQLRQRMDDGYEHAKRELGITQGKLPYGYSKSGKGKNTVLKIKEEEAEVIRKIYRASKEGMSQRKIAAILNQDNIKPPGKNTKKNKDPEKKPEWSQKSVQQILLAGRKEIYQGGMRNGWNELGIRWPQILPDDSLSSESNEEETEKDNPFSDLPKLKVPLSIPKLPPPPNLSEKEEILVPDSPSRPIPDSLPSPSGIRNDK